MQQEIHIREEDDCLIVNDQKIYASKELQKTILEEHNATPETSSISQFMSGQKLGGFVSSIGLPDFHLGYALPIGSIVVIDLSHPDASISPDGVGFDINCGVRCLKTNLFLENLIPSKSVSDTNTTSNINTDSDSTDMRNTIGDMLVKKIPFKDIPTGQRISLEELNGILDEGMKQLLKLGRVTQEDLENIESQGSLGGNNQIIEQKAKEKGLAQLGTLGSGNHYLEVEVIDQICNENIANKLGLKKGQIVISIHTGSRGLGHGCCTEILNEIKGAKETNKEKLKRKFREVFENSNLGKEEKKAEHKRIVEEVKNDKKLEIKNETLSFVKFQSEIGQKYLETMNSASNYAWANRSIITEKVREVFKELFPEVKIELIYDVCHNVAKLEKIDEKEFLILRKGASRILPPRHPDLPEIYAEIGQPVLVGGSMGTCSYLIVGAEEAKKTFYSTCHGAGRLVSRSKSKKTFSLEGVLEEMKAKDIDFRVGSKEGMVEECSGCYKDVEAVVEHSEKIGVSVTVCRVKPILVLKG